VTKSIKNILSQFSTKGYMRGNHISWLIVKEIY